MTLGVYAHVGKQDQTAAIGALPGVPGQKWDGDEADAAGLLEAA